MSKHTLDHEIELYREDDSYVVLVALEGYDREDVALRWRDNHLHIEAQHVDAESGRSQVLQRNMSFPKRIDEEGITATVDDGTLAVTLPISDDEHENVRTIDIE